MLDQIEQFRVGVEQGIRDAEAAIEQECQRHAERMASLTTALEAQQDNLRRIKAMLAAQATPPGEGST